MNGRVYDPVIGRFLTPDPNIQFVADLQSFNRYSYVLNNPLRNTDPPGYFAGAPRWLDPLVNTALVFGGAALCSTGGGCGVAITMISVAYNSASALSNGASVEYVVTTGMLNVMGSLMGGASPVISWIPDPRPGSWVELSEGG
jgi:hypothetical protein